MQGRIWRYVPVSYTHLDYKLSQEYYMDKAYDVLNPAGILMVIVPCSFMQSGFWEKTCLLYTSRCV